MPPTSPLQHAFDDWIAHQQLAGRLRHRSSAAVYGAMWQALVVWCLAQQPPLHLASLHGPALLGYLASRHGMLAADGLLSPRYQQRLISLVQRVQAHQAWRRQQRSAGPVQALALTTTDSGAAPFRGRSHTLLQATTSDGPEPPLHLLPAHAAQLQTMLGGTSDDATARWQQLRDRCAAALQLGGGLGPGNVRALRLADVRPDAPPDVRPGLRPGVQPIPADQHHRAATAPPTAASTPTPTPPQPNRCAVYVSADGNAPAHAAPLADWAAAVLARWLVVRQAQALAGPWLLPSTRSGKPWGKVAQYEAGRRVLADAGLDPDGGGSFRLRHSFALRQLQHGHDPALVANWLGVVDPQVMLRYQQAQPAIDRAAPGPASAQQTDRRTKNAMGNATSSTRPPWPV